ncbi:hypothetical protein JS44_16310 [Anoxybacillus flavithermus]|uniref:AMP-dependent synthetase/ligase domain-containing protein n=1 Tax=Anoxybacillus flavithermus TaxID=33934 RepID=A0A094LB80_9BACL|nr:hypothetical protein JS44_16310 [Anoxybacillus flavithermus]
MYTSGSTGKPKGVKVTHSNLEYILNNMQKYYPISRSDKYILSTPFTFDVSVVEIFGWIYGGGALVIPTQENSRNFRKLAHLIEVHKVTHIALSPAILNLMLDKLNEDDIDKLDRNLKYLMVAGEEFKASLAHKAIKYLKMFVLKIYMVQLNVQYMQRVIELIMTLIVQLFRLGRNLTGCKLKFRL